MYRTKQNDYLVKGLVDSDGKAFSVPWCCKHKRFMVKVGEWDELARFECIANPSGGGVGNRCGLMVDIPK